MGIEVDNVEKSQTVERKQCQVLEICREVFEHTGNKEFKIEESKNGLQLDPKELHNKLEALMKRLQKAKAPSMDSDNSDNRNSKDNIKGKVDTELNNEEAECLESSKEVEDVKESNEIMNTGIILTFDPSVCSQYDTKADIDLINEESYSRVWSDSIYNSKASSYFESPSAALINFSP